MNIALNEETPQPHLLPWHCRCIGLPLLQPWVMQRDRRECWSLPRAQFGAQRCWEGMEGGLQVKGGSTAITRGWGCQVPWQGDACTLLLAGFEFVNEPPPLTVLLPLQGAVFHSSPHCNVVLCSGNLNLSVIQPAACCSVLELWGRNDSLFIKDLTKISRCQV